VVPGSEIPAAALASFAARPLARKFQAVFPSGEPNPVSSVAAAAVVAHDVITNTKAWRRLRIEIDVFDMRKNVWLAVIWAMNPKPLALFQLLIFPVNIIPLALV